MPTFLLLMSLYLNCQRTPTQLPFCTSDITHTTQNAQHTDIPYSTPTHRESLWLLPSQRLQTLFALPTSHIHTYREYTAHTYHYYSTPTHTESYDFLPPSEPLFEKTTNFTECLDILLESGDGYEYTETFSVLLTATSDYKINASQNTTQITILDSDSECLVHVDYLQGVWIFTSLRNG